MFTGIIREVGTVRAVRLDGESCFLEVESPQTSGKLSRGDSVSVEGACLTAVQVRKGRFVAEVMPQTLRLTTLGDLKPGGRVNLEPSLTLQDPLGGHLVMGHVDSTGVVESLRREANAVWMRIRPPEEMLAALAPRGSVAVDGVSLTVASCREETFEVSLIPHTLASTTLGQKKPGSRVNLEADILARYVARMLAASGGKPAGETSQGKTPALTWSQLEEAGFS